jgi:uncharacterized protein
MAEIKVIEGLPGIGLVAKISSDYLIEKLEMKPYAEIYSEDFPQVAVFEQGEPDLNPAVRVFIDEKNEIAALTSDAPLSTDKGDFTDLIIDFIQENEMQPIFQVGMSRETEGDGKTLFYAKTGDVNDAWEEDLSLPPIAGGISGPTGALLEKALRLDIATLVLVIESDSFFPDPEAARKLIDEGIEPVTGIDVETENLGKSAEQITKQKKLLAEKMKEMKKKKSSKAYPREMYQ